MLGDLGYEGEAEVLTVAVKMPVDGALTDEQRTANKANNKPSANAETRC